MSLPDMWNYATDACWIMQSNGNKTSKALADKLDEWSKIENDYAKKLAAFKKSVAEDKVFSEVQGSTLGDGLVQLFTSLAIEIEKHGNFSKKLEATSTDLTKWRKAENQKAKEQLNKADKIMKEFQNLKAKTLKTQQFVEKAAKTLEHYIDRRDGADGEVVAAKLEEAKAKFLRTEESYFEDYDTAQKQLLDHKPALTDIMKYMEEYEQERIAHLKEILDNLMEERINNSSNISKALTGVKKLIDCVNVQMDLNNFLAQVRYPEEFVTVNTRTPLIQSLLNGNPPPHQYTVAGKNVNKNALAAVMAISDLSKNNTDSSSAASIRIDPHLLGLLSANSNNTSNPQLVLQQALQGNNNNNNSYTLLPPTGSSSSNGSEISYDNVSCISNNNNCMEVLYNYESTQSGVLSVKAGDIIKNVKAINDEWISGEINGNRGMLPKTFVKPILTTSYAEVGTNQIVSNDVYPLSCVAVYDCISNDSKVLKFSKGERLYYRNSGSNVQSGWLEGKNERGQCGLIPESYINKL